MSISGILKNIKNKGIAETYRLHVERKKELDENREELTAAKAKRLAAARVVKESLEAVGADPENIAKADAVISEMESCGVDRSTPAQLKKWNRQLRRAETGECRDWLRRKYIKEEIPAAYDERRNDPVEDKIVFMQARHGVSQACKYIYNKIETEYPFEPVLCELYRGMVSSSELYLNAVDFAREAATAKAIMVHSSSPYLGYIDIRPETKVVQLWHGCGVIKHLGLTAAGSPGVHSREHFEEFPEYNKYDLVTICSEEQRRVFEDFMGKEKGDPVIKAWGMTLTDEFFDPEFVENCHRKMHEAIPASKDKKIILYAPTYRGRSPHREAPRLPDIAKFAKELADDYIFIIKQHQTVPELPEIPEEYRDSFAYDMTRGTSMNINELMCVADIMISDYSSVIFEYSLFERPIIFYMYDLEDYRDTRGMYYSYEELAECGPIFMDDDPMVEYIAHIDERFDKSRVAAFREKYMSACDGHATERVMTFVMEG